MANKADLDVALAALSHKVDVKSEEVKQAINNANSPDLADSIAEVGKISDKVDAIPTVPTTQPPIKPT